MRRSTRALAVTSATLAVAILGLPLPATGIAPNRPIKVMTRNLDNGTDFGPVLTASSPQDFLTATAATWEEIKASNIPERAAGIAAEIAATQPDLVSLQEVSIFRTGPFLGTVPATDVQFDALKSLETALGPSYREVVKQPEFDFEVPTFDPNPFDIRLSDFDVILARADLPQQMTLSNAQSDNFVNRLTLRPPPGLPPQPPLLRGWSSVDVTFPGSELRFIDAHLETLDNNVQQAQADELLQAGGPAATKKPVIIAGDFNTGPDVTGTNVSPTYQHLLDKGLTDTWPKTQPGNAGFTWPLHGEDQFASTTPTPTTPPTQRIDLVLTRGAVTAVSDMLVGNSATADLTRSRLWPSDHAGVVAMLQTSAG